MLFYSERTASFLTKEIDVTNYSLREILFIGCEKKETQNVVDFNVKHTQLCLQTNGAKTFIWTLLKKVSHQLQ